MAKELDKLKLGKGNVFVKSQLKRLRQEDETWEADFRPLPKPVSQMPQTTSVWSSLDQTVFFVPMQKSNDLPM